MYTMSSTVGSLYLRKFSFHKWIKKMKFSFWYFAKYLFMANCHLYSDLECRNYSDGSLEMLKIDKMDWLIAYSFELLWKYPIYLNHAMKKSGVRSYVTSSCYKLLLVESYIKRFQICHVPPLLLKKINQSENVQEKYESGLCC